MHHKTRIFLYSAAALTLLILAIEQRLTVQAWIFVGSSLAVLSWTLVREQRKEDVLSDANNKSAQEAAALMTRDPRQKSVVVEFLKADAAFFGAIRTLRDLGDWEVSVYSDIFPTIASFIDMYARILVRDRRGALSRAGRQEYEVLHDTRLKILRSLHHLYVSLPQPTITPSLDRIVTVIQSSTYKCMNVLKNKYNVRAYETPVSPNTYDQDVHVMY